MKTQSCLGKIFRLVLPALLVHISLAGQTLTVRDIMAEPSIAGMRAEGEKLSPDGSRVVYLWNADGKMPRDLYLVATSGGTPTKILTVADLPKPYRAPEKENKLDYGLVLRDDFVRARENQLGGFEWSPDSRQLIFSYGGDLYILPSAGGVATRLTQTQTPETAPRFLDAERILFSQGGNLFVWNLKTNLIAQISKEANQPNFIGVFAATPNKAGSMVAYAVSDSSKQRALIVPNYLDEFTAAPTFRRGWSEQKVLVMPTNGSRDTPFEIKLPKPEGVSNFRQMKWAADGKSLIIDRLDKDTKRRQLFYVRNVGEKDEKIILVTEETDDKWQAPLSAIFEPHPKNPDQLFFASERDGFNHLYLATVDASAASPTSEPAAATGIPTAAGTPGRGDSEQTETRTAASVAAANANINQITRGNWQVEWAKWTPAGSIVHSSTEGGAAERQLRILNPASGETTPLTSSPGMKSNAQMNETADEPVVVFEQSRWNQPGELYAVRVCAQCQRPSGPVQLSRTAPSGFSSRSWTEPKFVDIPSRDGKMIPSKIYLPANFNPRARQKYPMAIFVHGAGYLQNTINGWNNYYREFMFNDMLAKKGYVVLDIDYRGSAGYGREWRTDVYDFLGGKDFDDHLDAIDYMVKNYNVNQAKIGVYGGSYGGFMAGMLAMRAPERIAAAAALRPVFDWKNYYASSPGYTAQRLGFPDKNPEAYRRSSPITYADKLERPLLILHGMADDNVHVQDSVQLIEKLIRLNKSRYFEAMLYPSENHAFVRPESWADEYERILAFFDKHLK